MPNERKSRFNFTPDSLRAAGFVEQPDGSWAKRPAPDLGSVDAAQHGKQTRALDHKTPAKRRRAAGRPKSNIRDRAPVLTVTMTAYLHTRMDGDNLANALKPVRDELADWLGVDDADGRVRWECGQVETRGAVGVVVSILALGGAVT